MFNLLYRVSFYWHHLLHQCVLPHTKDQNNYHKSMSDSQLFTCNFAHLVFFNITLSHVQFFVMACSKPNGIYLHEKVVLVGTPKQVSEQKRFKIKNWDIYNLELEVQIVLLFHLNILIIGIFFKFRDMRSNVWQTWSCVVYFQCLLNAK